MAKRNITKNSQSFLSQIKWGESYTSLFLGAVVVVIALILVFSFIRARNAMNQQTDSTSTQTQESSLPSSYTVKQGDDLWSISNKIYGSGYNWVDLANANKLKNPNILYVGTNLTVPNVKPKFVNNNNQTIQPKETTIKGSSYIVVKGDYLWDIAIRAYGDGYKWVEIAKANKLVNPNIIHSGNVLVLPR